MLKNSTLTRWIGAATLGLGLLAGPAQARDFVKTVIDLDMKSQEFNATFQVTGDDPKPLLSPKEIADGIFTRLDLKIAFSDPEVAQAVRREVDDSYAGGEPSGCGPDEGSPWTYGALTMEDGLRYTFSVDVPEADAPGGVETIAAVIFPGNRSDHFANDVFCEYSPELGAGGGVLRVTGFYYVIHRKTQQGWDVQLRAVQLTSDEIANNF